MPVVSHSVRPLLPLVASWKKSPRCVGIILLDGASELIPKTPAI